MHVSKIVLCMRVRVFCKFYMTDSLFCSLVRMCLDIWLFTNSHHLCQFIEIIHCVSVRLYFLFCQSVIPISVRVFCMSISVFSFSESVLYVLCFIYW